MGSIQPPPDIVASQGQAENLELITARCGSNSYYSREDHKFLSIPHFIIFHRWFYSGLEPVRKDPQDERWEFDRPGGGYAEEEAGFAQGKMLFEQEQFCCNSHDIHIILSETGDWRDWRWHALLLRGLSRVWQACWGLHICVRAWKPHESAGWKPNVNGIGG